MIGIGDEKSIKSLKPGDMATVLVIQCKEKSQLRKLAAFGILPGVKVRVLQTYPCYVLGMGNSEVALDHIIVEKIIVTKK
ncbi:transcriptional repressor c-terminal [Lucifera butyrica]|uniref:Transcriptional repressor c-terminal n=1 Tax=Lucifera butyrica TaxID=1351585 RepID=A0A498R479_9FIRM|nr:ferrous iron transport protein A [Lucifera butyrica]VBB06231.1 transcriptional repressor c-terminal [Lucifera butyrica]